MKRSSDLAARGFTVLAAIFFVVAFALATLLPPMLSLAELVASWDHQVLVSSQDFVRAHVGDWVWFRLVLPVLVRPSWLLPATLGLIAAGAALTANSRHGPQRTRRRRS